MGLVAPIFGDSRINRKRRGRGSRFGVRCAPVLTGNGRRRAAATGDLRWRRGGVVVDGFELREAWKLQGGLGTLGVGEEDVEELHGWPATCGPRVEDDRRGEEDEIRRPYSTR